MTNENLEERTQNSEGRIPSKLSGNCPNCKTGANFVYIGRITSVETQIDNYNCNKCESTFVLDSLLGKYGARYEQEDLINHYNFKEPESRSAVKAQIRELFAPMR